MMTVDDATNSAERMWSTGMTHTTFLLGTLLALFGIYKAVLEIRKRRKEVVEAREEAIIARAKQEELLQEIVKEFRPNHGSSMADRQIRIENSVNEHSQAAKTWWVDNDEAHDKIHRRIDGLFELIGGATMSAPRKAAARHQGRETSPYPEDD